MQLAAGSAVVVYVSRMQGPKPGLWYQGLKGYS